jgi:transposase
VPCHVLSGLMWPKPRGTWPCAPLEHAGPSQTMPARWRRSWSGSSPSPPLLVREATGGLERAVTSAWAAAGLPVVVVPPRQARDCARATGQWAKTDAVEARALAPCADVIRPTPRPLPDAQTPELRALWGRRQQLIGMRTAEQNRLAGTRARLTKDMMAHMTWLNTAMAPLDNDLETTLRASPLWRANADLWQSAKGMGPVWARTLLRALPELGTLTRQHIAA